MTDDTLTLDVSDRPTIERGDTLAIEPDVGAIYRAKVVAVEPDQDRIKARISTSRGPNKTLPFYRDELERFYVTGHMWINPDDPHLSRSPV